MVDMGGFRDAVEGWAAGGAAGAVREVGERVGVRTVVLVEGLSDLAAVDATAARRGRDLAAEGVCVVSMGGAMNVGRYGGILGPRGMGLRLVGLCDAREQGFYERGFSRAGAGDGAVFVCVADLEDELVRALGTERVEDVIRTAGDLRPWQTLLHQPAHQGRPREAVLRRFFGTRKGRKIRYGRLLVEALEPGEAPAPLDALFAAL